MWRTFFVPAEIINAAGLIPLTPERLLSALAMRPEQRNIFDYINGAEAGGHDRKQCSFIKGMSGYMNDPANKKPSALITSHNFCGAVPSVLEHMAEDSKLPHFHLNIPLHTASQEDVVYTAEQLKRLAAEMCKLGGISLQQYNSELLPRAIELSRAAAEEWRKIQALRCDHPNLLEQPGVSDLAVGLSDDWGTETFLRFLSDLRRKMELECASPNASTDGVDVRLYWVHLRPYFPNEVFKIIRDHRAAICCEGVNTIFWDELGRDDPYMALAKKAIDFAEMSRYGERYQGYIRDTIVQNRVDGMVYFYQDNCEWADATFPSIRNHVCGTSRSKALAPLLSLHAECLIEGARNVITTRLSAFLQGLQQAKGCRPGNAPARPRSHPIPSPEDRFVGVDAGSTFVKAVLIGRDGQVLSRARRRVDSDVAKSVSRCLTDLGLEPNAPSPGWAAMTATGVSQDCVFKADDRLSEILCHTAAVRKLMPEAGAFIEVGGQDVKGVDLATGASELNDRCAAGVGTFLENFAAMLKLTRRARLKLYNTADYAVQFPSLCKAIIETEVRHAVARREPLERIVKGFYDALARIVVNSVRVRIPSSTSVVGLCGGAAMDPTFVCAMRKALGSKHELRVPDLPIYTGALGAALLARELSVGRRNGVSSCNGAQPPRFNPAVS